MAEERGQGFQTMDPVLSDAIEEEDENQLELEIEQETPDGRA